MVFSFCDSNSVLVKSEFKFKSLDIIKFSLVISEMTNFNRAKYRRSNKVSHDFLFSIGNAINQIYWLKTVGSGWNVKCNLHHLTSKEITYVNWNTANDKLSSSISISRCFRNFYNEFKFKSDLTMHTCLLIQYLTPRRKSANNEHNPNLVEICASEASFLDSFAYCMVSQSANLLD